MATRRLCWIVAVGLCCLTSVDSTRAADPWHVSDVAKRSKEWPEWARSKQKLVVEGRYSSSAPDVLRMRNFDLPFRATMPNQFRQIKARPNSVLVLTGTLGVENQVYFFLVSDVQAGTSEIETYRLRSGLIRGEKPDEWRVLAEWTLSRGRFYDDDSLRKLGADALLKWYRIRRERVGVDDAAGLKKLGEEAWSAGVDKAIWQEPIHSAFLIEWRKAKAEPAKHLVPLMAAIKKEYPESQQPLVPPQPKLKARYLEDANGTYRAADGETRLRLHRILLAELLLLSVRQKFQDDPLEGFRIAAEVDRLVPEEHPLAEEYREREITARKQKLSTSTRAEAVSLSSLIRGRNRVEEARGVLRTWLEAETKRLRAQKSLGLIRASDEYLSLLEDEKTAASLLLEADRIAPETAEVRQKLARLGYQFQQGKWLTRAEVQQMPADPRAVAIQQGEVLIGMTPHEVRLALGGSPSLVTRVALSGRVEEIWTFGTSTEPTLVVHFLRQTSEPRGNARVKSVWKAKPQTPPASMQ